MLVRDEVYSDVIKAVLTILSNRDRHYILSCSTLAPTIGKTDTLSVFKKWFKDLKVIESSQLHHLPTSLHINTVKLPDQYSHEEDSDTLLPNYPVERLAAIIKEHPEAKFVVFAAFISRGSALQEGLEAHGITSAMVFGEMVVEHRVQNMNRFLSGEVRVLIGGEVVSRGLAMDCSHVALFDIPHNLGQLIHKVGRTAIMNRPGELICFYKPDDEALVTKMLKHERFEVTYPQRSRRRTSQESNFADTQLDHELSELSD